MLRRGVPLSDHEWHALGGPHLRAASGLVSFKAWCRCGRILPRPADRTSPALHPLLLSLSTNMLQHTAATFRAGQKQAQGAQPALIMA